MGSSVWNLALVTQSTSRQKYICMCMLSRTRIHRFKMPIPIDQNQWLKRRESEVKNSSFCRSHFCFVLFPSSALFESFS